MLRVAFISNASFIAETLIHIPKGSYLYRMTVTILAFCISGFVHIAGAWSVNPKCHAWPTMYWYILMGTAVISEDLLRRMYLWMTRRQQRNRPTGGWWKMFGYVWVWMFLVWSMPKIMFPMVDCDYIDELTY